MAALSRPTALPRVAVVTGAASGIGAATLALLVERGWRVAALDLDAARLHPMVRRVNAPPAAADASETGAAAGAAAAAAAAAPHATEAARAFVADVADEAQVADAFAAIEAAFGAIDALVTSAGIADMTPFMDLSVATFRRVHDVNVIGTFLCIREAARACARARASAPSPVSPACAAAASRAPRPTPRGKAQCWR